MTGLEHAEFRALERKAHHFADIRFVVDDKNGGHLRGSWVQWARRRRGVAKELGSERLARPSCRWGTGAWGRGLLGFILCTIGYGEMNTPVSMQPCWRCRADR
ncbi:hypothetical protein McPS_19450 [Marichromatium sp. PS1]